MATEVIKRDENKQPFDAEKMKSSIEKAAKDVGLPDERVAEIAEQVSAKALQLTEGKGEIAASELREAILSELDSVEPSIAEAWRKYDKETKGL